MCEKKTMMETFQRMKSATIKKLMKDERIYGTANQASFKSWVSLGYDRGYIDAINSIKRRHIEEIVYAERTNERPEDPPPIPRS